MNNSIDWFEICVLDLEKAITFYSEILGIEFQQGVIKGLNMAFFTQGTTRGALVEGAVGSHYEPSDKGSLIYLHGGDDLDEVLKKIEGSGGKVLVEKTLITKEIGYYAFFKDVDGNKLGLHSYN